MKKDCDNFTHKKSIKSTKCKQATFIQMFLYAQKTLKNRQATFTHKQHKKYTNKPSLINNIKSKQAIPLGNFLKA